VQHNHFHIRPVMPESIEENAVSDSSTQSKG
jgi:hypothetical protein